MEKTLVSFELINLNLVILDSKEWEVIVNDKRQIIIRRREIKNEKGE
jgi:hypothetical protein